MKWNDINQIVDCLIEKFPYMNFEQIRDISFVKLYEMIFDLEDFDDKKENCNEKILEAIQASWIEEL